MSSLRKYTGVSLLILSMFAVVISNVNAGSGDMPIISFTNPTPANGTITTQKYAYINTTIINSSNTTAFIDWNNSLVGWWRFNNETGESSKFFRDWSSKGNNATCSGTACPISTPGIFGNAMSFDGKNDYLNAGNSSSLNVTDATTVEAWIYPKSDFVGYAAQPINKWSSTTDANVVLYYFGTTASGGRNRTIRFYANRGGTWGTISGSYKLELNKWYHIALSYNSTRGGQLYVNGVPIGTLTGSGKLASNTRPLKIGGGSYFNGTIDEVRIHNRALSPDEIKASYNAGVYTLYSNFANLTEGVYNYRAYAQDGFGIVNQTETRTLNIMPIPVPSISFTDLTPANGTITTQKHAYIDTTIINSSNTTAFIDWNSSLVGWWRFNNEAGENKTFFRDWGSWENNARCSGSKCPISTPGMFGNALSFDGVNDYTSAGNNVAINSSYSIEGWVKIPTNPGSANRALMSLSATPGGYPRFSPNFRTSNRPSIYLNASNYRYGSTNLADNKWHHIAFIIMGTNAKDILKAKIYVDGIEEAYGSTASTSLPVAPTGTAWIGTNSFNGTLDEIRIHNRALSTDEIKASYDSRIYRLHGNFTNLTEGVYNYRAYVQNSDGILNQTETRTLNITKLPPVLCNGSCSFTVNYIIN